MDYRAMERTGEKISLLGFGCMRFPEKNGEIDETEAKELLDTAYLAGVNYFDTAWVYHNGKSEEFTGRALDAYPRDTYRIATKLPCWEVQTLEDAKRIFEQQLVNLRKDYIDFYLLHSLDITSWRHMCDLGVIAYCESLQREGKIRYFGFSFHDEYASFEEIARSRHWDFLQIQLNYTDTEEQAGIRGYRLAEELGIPVIVMEPVKGGNLASYPADIDSILKEIRPELSTASWALRWVAELPNVLTVLSGMSTMEQVRDNLSTMTDCEPLRKEEKEGLARVVVELGQRVNNGCTGCRYCMPCPFGVDIPANFHIWNLFGIFRNPGNVRWDWGIQIKESEKARNCIECGKCEELCPQNLSIREDLKKVQRELDEVLAGTNAQ